NASATTVAGNVTTVSRETSRCEGEVPSRNVESVILQIVEHVLIGAAGPPSGAQPLFFDELARSRWTVQDAPDAVERPIVGRQQVARPSRQQRVGGAQARRETPGRAETASG